MRKNIPIILTILSTLSGLAAIKFKVDENTLLLTLAILLLIFLLSFEHAETKTGKGTHYSIFDKLKGLILDKLKNPFRNQFKSRFENLLLVGVDDKESKQKIDEISDYYTKIDSIKPTISIIPKDLKSINSEKIKGDFTNKIKASDGVLFVRSKSFDNHDWITEIIDDWGINNSSFAVLRIDYLVEQNLPNANSNKKAQHFQLIPNDVAPSIIPWHLYSKVNERSSDWRSQASFNRMITFFLISSIIILSTAYFLMNQNNKTDIADLNAKHNLEIQKVENKIATQIQETKKERLKFYDMVLNSESDKLEQKYSGIDNLQLSVWEQDSSLCRQIAKTHDQTINYELQIDTTFIGYSMMNLGNHYLWTEIKENEYFNLTSKKSIEGKRIFPIKEHRYKTIICYSMTEHNDEKVLGICADIPEGDDRQMRNEDFLIDLDKLLRKYYFEITKEK